MKRWFSWMRSSLRASVMGSRCIGAATRGRRLRRLQRARCVVAFVWPQRAAAKRRKPRAPQRARRGSVFVLVLALLPIFSWIAAAGVRETHRQAQLSAAYEQHSALRAEALRAARHAERALTAASPSSFERAIKARVPGVSAQYTVRAYAPVEHATPRTVFFDIEARAASAQGSFTLRWTRARTE